MNKKEVYNYGTFFALIKEQNEAHEKQVVGKLGRWGKARMKPRDETIFKFATKILRNKAKIFSSMEEILESVKSDLAFISSDNNVWGEVPAQEIKDAERVFMIVMEAHSK